MTTLECREKSEPLIFFSSNNELVERLDPAFYVAIDLLKKDIVDKSKFECVKLVHLCNIQRGRFGHRPRNDPRFYGGKYPFIQTGDIVKASSFNNKIKFTQTLNEKGLLTSRLFEGRHLLFTIAANIGDTAILDYPCCFPDSVVSIIPKNDNLLLDYLNYYLRLIKSYVIQLAPYSAQRNLNNQQLAQIPIISPSLSIQAEVVKIMDKAYKEKEKKYNEAKNQLRNIDTLIKEMLSIDFPEKVERTIENRIFVTSIANITGDRFDPDYNFSGYKKLESALSESSFHLKSLNEISRRIYQGVGKKSTKEDDVKLLKVKNIRNGNKINFNSIENVELTDKTKLLHDGDIISPFIGEAIKKYKFSVFKKQPIEFTVDNNTGVIRLNGGINANYIAEFLMSSLGRWQLDKLTGGGGVPFIGSTYAGRLQVVLPPKEMQDNIANAISIIRTNADELYAQGNKVLEDAQQKVIKLLLRDV